MSYGMDVVPRAGTLPPPRQRGAGGTILNSSSNTADSQLVTGSGALLYWNAHETTGAAAGVIALYDGSSAGGQRIATIALGNGAVDTHDFFDDGLPIERGIFVHVVTGSVELAVCFGYDPPAGYS